MKYISNLNRQHGSKPAGGIASEEAQLNKQPEMIEMAQLNIDQGYIEIRRQGDTYTLEMRVVDGFVSLKGDFDNITELRAMLWDAMRKQGRGFEISISDVLRIEEVRHKGRYSVEGYKEEINWTIDLLQRHLTRIESWQDSLNLTPAEDRGVYGKLDEFLSQLEEQPRSVEDDEDDEDTGDYGGFGLATDTVLGENRDMLQQE